MSAGEGLTVLYGQSDIARNVQGLGVRIAEDFPEGNIACVGVLPNCMVFMADLIRAIDRSLTCDFLTVGTSDSRRVDIAFGSPHDYHDRDVLLIQGIVDTGVTLNFITGHIEETWRPRSLRVAALIDRQNRRKVQCELDYVGFDLSTDGWVAGYGLGHQEHQRGAPFLGIAAAETT